MVVAGGSISVSFAPIGILKSAFFQGGSVWWMDAVSLQENCLHPLHQGTRVSHHRNTPSQPNLRGMEIPFEPK